MRRALAATWLAIVAAAGLYLTVLGIAGFPIRTDLMALLPREERDPVLKQANEAVARSLGRRIVLAFGDNDRNRARTAAQQVKDAVLATGLVDPVDGPALQDAGRRLGTFYLPHREVLLSTADRTALADGRAAEIGNRALAQTYGFGSPVDATLLAADPFLLLPAFLIALPGPLERLSIDDGMLMIAEGSMTWIVVPMTLRHDPFDLDVQEKLITKLDEATGRLAQSMPDVKTLRVGSIFFADHGARTAIDEVTLLAFIEIAGTILLIVGVFRRLSPLLLNLMALGVGIAVAFAGTFLLFGEIHVAALLFGTSLIGVAVDYGLHYSCTAFSTAATTGRQRLAFVMPAISLGLVTTLIGYSALAIAPFPGLRQIAVFAIIGLISAFATVVLWFPLLDRLAPLRHGAGMMKVAAFPWVFWTSPRFGSARALLVFTCAATLVMGLANYRADDDVRRLQVLSPALLLDQQHLQRLIGANIDAQHILISATDDEAALQRQEALVPVLDRLVAEGALSGYQMPATFIPSLARQGADRTLVMDRLIEPHLARHLAQLGLPAPTPRGAPAAKLTIETAVTSGAVPLLSDFVVAPGIHIVALKGLQRSELVAAAVAPLNANGVRFVDPTADFSRLLGTYRSRAISMTAISVLVVASFLTWRYGPREAFWTILPPIVSALLVPAVLSLVGEPFTFFHAMGLVLVVAIGVDYTIFCVETPTGHHSITMLAILLATFTTLLSFGLLGLSSARAVQAFGFTLLIGIVAAYLLSPLASRAMVSREVLTR